MRNILKFLVTFFILTNVTRTCLALPTIDPGVFVIQGVPTCRNGLGYCLLGTNCTMDRDFVADDQGGHCSEVTKSFTSILSFVCCKFVNDKEEAEEDVYRTTISPVTVMEDKFQLLDENPIPVEESYDTEVSEDEDTENLVDIIGIVTDSTGIISLVTRPYQPPEKSSTPSSVSPVISPSMISSASSSSNSTTAVSTLTENEDLNIVSTASPNDIRPKIIIEVLNNNGVPERIELDAEPGTSTVKSQIDTADLVPQGDSSHSDDSTFSDKTTSSSLSDERVSNVIIITSEPETSSYILSTSDVNPDNETKVSSKDRLENPSNEIITSNSFTNSSSQIRTSNEETIHISNEASKFQNASSIEDTKSTNDESTEKSLGSQTNSNSDSFDPQNVINQITEMLSDDTTDSQSPEDDGSDKSKSTTTTTTSTSVQTVTDINEETNSSISNEVPVNNQIEVLNLPEEIRNYLEKKQAEKKKRKDDTAHTSTEGKLSTNPIISTTLEVSSDDVFNHSTTTNFPNTDMVLIPVNLPNLQETPLVPLVWTKTSPESTTVAQRPTMKFSSEGLLPSTYRTTMLQKFEGPNAIQINKDKEDSLKQTAQDKEDNTKQAAQELIIPHPINLNICGLRTPSVMLSEYSRAASTYDWCWSAALMRKEPGSDRFECSGTLIELDLVVTTAACLKRLRRDNLALYRVVLGDSNLRDDMPYGVQYLDIAEIVAHPDYLTSGGAHTNDIGVVRLRQVATLDHNVCLACISQRNAHIPSHTCVVSGYTLGNLPHYIRRDVEGFTPVDGILRESLVKLQKPSECRASVEKLSPNPLIVADPNSFLCDEKRKSARACVNSLDGGSPLVCEVGGRWFLTGIASWSRDCSSDPNIYTKVNSFSDWFLNTRLRMYGFITHRLL